ncbi:MAG: succinylglutamate desuccinylase [Bacteriovoracaceae bacterium]|jgi:succinylglutamate desuccinylase
MDLDNYIEYLLNEKSDFSPCEKLFENALKVSTTRRGMLELTPPNLKSAKKAYIYSCGIHGNETAPIEIISDLIRDLANGSLVLTHPLLIIFGHVQAMRESKRFLFDNLNRMFNDKYKDFPKDHLEASLGKEIQDSISDFFLKHDEAEKVHYDLHTAIKPSAYKRFAIYPYLHDRDHSQDQINIMAAMGIEAVLLNNGPATTLSYHSSFKHSAHAFTLELGKVETFGNNIRENFTEAEDVLRKLISSESLNMTEKSPVIFKVKKELIRHEEDYSFNIADDVPNFTSFPIGSILAEDKVEKYITTEEDERIVFPKGDVKVGQRSGLVVVPITLS